jgi:DNA-binding MarR family transcriptional regulator
MSKQTRFARAFIPWVSAWSEMGLSGTQERVLLLLISNMEPDGHGGFTSWYPRAEMANVLGLSEVTVKNAINALIRKDAIRRLGKSYRGRAQKYVIMPRSKGVVTSNPNHSERGYSGGPNGVATTVPKGLPTATPSRTLECASASLSQPSARNRYKQADGTDNAVL